MSSKSVIAHTISLYQKSGWKSFFAKGRFWYAPFQEVEQLLPKEGTIIDLGCGEGIFTNFIGLSSPKRHVLGIEIDPQRFQLTHRGVKNVTFQLADITKAKVPKANAIILFHVLHHLHTYEEQEQVLKTCVNHLQPQGKIIIVEIFVRPTIQYVLSWITDHLLVAWFFEKRFYSPILFRNVSDWKSLLKISGLFCTIIFPKGLGKPFSNIIFVCEKQR